MRLSARVTALCALLVAGAYGSPTPAYTTGSVDPECVSLDKACDNLWTSIQCGVTKKCIPRWEVLATSEPGNDTELCSLCKEMVQEAKDQLLSNETQSELRQVLEGSCDILVPFKPLKSICKDLMIDFLDELNDMLVSRMNPTQVCTVSGLCWTAGLNEDLFKRIGQVMLRRSMQLSKCESCKRTVENIASFTRLLPKEEALTTFTDSVKGDANDQKLEHFIRIYVDKFFDTFNSATPERTCQALKQCPGKAVEILPPMMVGVQDDIECEFCEAMVHKFASSFNNSAMKSEVKQALENICKLVGSWSQECLDRVEKNFDEDYDELLSLLDPPVVCGLFGLCNDHVKPMMKLLSASQPDTMKWARMTYAVDNPSMLSERKPVETEGEICDECQKYAKYIVEVFANKRAEDTFEAVFEMACQLVPNVDKCVAFVDKHLEELYKLLNEKVTVEHICKGLHLCSQRMLPPPVARTSIQGQECIFCHTIAELIFVELKDNRTEAAILNALDKVCKIAPEWDREQCENTINTYLGAFLDSFKKEETPEGVCKSLHLCATQSLTASKCDVCIILANWVLEEVKDNKTEAALFSALEEVCDVLPKSSVNTCKNVIDTYGELLIDYLKKGTTPEELCKAVHVCTAPAPTESSTARQAPPAQVAVKSNNQCGVCKIVAEWLVDEIKDNKTDDRIIAALEKVCKYVPINPETCKNYIDSYGNALIDLLKNDLTPDEICTKLGLCMPHPVVRGPICKTCEIVLEWVINKIAGNRSEAVILEALDAVCSVIPVDRSECRKFIDTYGDEIFKLLRNGIAADLICSSIQLCSVPPVKVERPYSPCATCTLVVDIVLDKLKGQKTEDAIVAVVEKVCNYVPASMAAECRQYVDTYGEELIKLIAQDLNAQEVCTALRLCSAPPRSRQIVRDSPMCTQCQIVVNVVKSALENNNTRAELEEILTKVCSFFPKQEQASCRNIVDVYTEYIIELLDNTVSPEEICQTLGFCAAPPSDPKCEICIFIANFVDSQLGNERNKAKIIELLDKVCDYVPSEDQARCRAMIEQYTDMYITLLTKMVTPQEICREIRQCPANRQRSSTKPEYETSIASRQNTEVIQPKVEKCSLCKWLVAWVDNKLEDNRTEEVIKEELSKACYLLSDPTECKAMVHDYVEMIVKMLVEYADPEKVCEALHKCPKKEEVQVRRTDTPCQLCIYLVDELRVRLSNKSTEAEIKNELDQLCSLLPEGNEECKALVNEYLDVLIQMAVEKADAEQICQFLRQCPRRIELPETATECGLCHVVMDFVSAELKNEDTDDKIIEVIEKVCGLLPAAHREDCYRMVEIEGTVLVRMIAQSVNASSICEAIRFCPRTLRTVPDIVCTWCQYGLHYIQEKLYDNSTQIEIQAELEKMCAELKDPNLVQDCKEFIDIYGPSIEVVIAQSLDPSIVCPAIHACPARRALNKGRRPSTSRCNDCIHSMKAFRQNPRGMCSGANAQFFAKCEIAASTVGLGILDVVGSFKMCKMAKACSSLEGSFSCSNGCEYVA